MKENELPDWAVGARGGLQVHKGLEMEMRQGVLPPRPTCLLPTSFLAPQPLSGVSSH